MIIRRATPRDARAASNVLRRSIEELCVADHRDDPALKEAWLANKTQQTVRRWIADPAGRVLVAEVDGSVAGVAAVRADGEIVLNYVAPEARFTGVSKALLAAIESYLLDEGVKEARLSSTLTARRFYLEAGYREAEEEQISPGLDGQPMEKALG
jgi:GNAT superfamily N-acetyltransferase